MTDRRAKWVALLRLRRSKTERALDGKESKLQRLVCNTEFVVLSVDQVWVTEVESAAHFVYEKDAENRRLYQRVRNNDGKRFYQRIDV